MMRQHDDIVFALRAVGATGAWDLPECERVLSAYGDFVDSRVAPSNIEGDREGCRIKDGRVHLPAGLPELYRDYVDLGWQLLPLSPGIGGIGAPHGVCCAATEMLGGANHAFQMLVGLVPGAIRVIERFGTAAQQAELIPPLAAGTALATMCLTEPGAGSDLGAIGTVGRSDAQGDWALTGDKIFVSGGDQDLSQTILHLVLARTGSAGEGTKGLSLFACPSHLPDGNRNAIHLLRIEQKLGLHASPTCQLRFEGAAAHLLGRPGEGLTAMFVMMDHARLDVAMQGVAHAARAHTLARDYAAQRRQGGRIIAEHGDVARMLLEMDALAMGTRAMALRTAALLDDTDLASFLTPVCKVFCTEAATTVADNGIQVLGGYGYLPEYGMEQIWRDARVTRLYEGTNGVLAMTLVKRLLGGAGETAFRREIEAAMALAPSPAVRQGAETVLSAWHTARTAIEPIADRGMVAAPFMRLTGLLYFAACWIRLEAAGSDAADPGRIARPARFVRAALLPEAISLRIRCEAMATADEDQGNG
ncbi:acyl-CoA dehydrogenase family protein [Devosia sp. SL43]|uniref:acyl-CoA dehydrogenase family protein n=1 Tax=Devosia sp. SL43 TaxID=2806348 RepID=UPI001F3F50D7|nr:acyl-CoA dehydrogenase family protein [Devosia sp. SL43]UJW84227.1 acyl-CoA dehydrogenase family protein [Devosia sp. SL43]